MLISDYSSDVQQTRPGVLALQKGVDGLVAGNAVMRFKEAID